MVLSTLKPSIRGFPEGYIDIAFYGHGQTYRRVALSSPSSPKESPWVPSDETSRLLRLLWHSISISVISPDFAVEHTIYLDTSIYKGL